MGNDNFLIRKGLWPAFEKRSGDSYPRFSSGCVAAYSAHKRMMSLLCCYNGNEGRHPVFSTLAFKLEEKLILDNVNFAYFFSHPIYSIYLCNDWTSPINMP